MSPFNDKVLCSYYAVTFSKDIHFVQDNMATPTYHRAFPNNVIHHTSVTLTTCDWSNFDDVEVDLHALSKKVVNLMPAFQRTGTKRDINEQFTHVKQRITEERYNVYEGVNVLLNYFRYSIQSYLNYLRCTDSGSRHILKGCKNVKQLINKFESDVSGCDFGQIDKHLDPSDAVIQFHSYTKKNKLFFDNLPTSQRLSVEKLIDCNLSCIENGDISAREAVRNVECYVDEVLLQGPDAL